MRVWNVELGLAVHVEAPNGRYIVIDLGSSQSVSPLRHLSGEDVGYLVITHPHLDHFSDILNFEIAKPNVLWRVHAYTDAEIMEGAQERDKLKFKKYCDVCTRYNGTLSPSESPATGEPFEGLTATVYSSSSCDKNNKNNFSGIVVLKLGNAKIVVCGDNEKESFQHLMLDMDFKEAVSGSYVLVAPHHGRESGYYKDFVSCVKPLITIISDTSKGTTSVTEKYGDDTIGFKVHNCVTSKDESRYCLTTRNDGNIDVTFGETDIPGYLGTLYIETHVR